MEEITSSVVKEKGMNRDILNLCILLWQQCYSWQVSNWEESGRTFSLAFKNFSRPLLQATVLLFKDGLAGEFE